jgi:hypothetical protein
MNHIICTRTIYKSDPLHAASFNLIERAWHQLTLVTKIDAFRHILVFKYTFIYDNFYGTEGVAPWSVRVHVRVKCA